MAITLRYQPDALGLATVAEATGVGQFQQAQDRLALEQEALAQRDRQFNEELNLRRNLAALQNQQQNRSLGANMYQFEAQRQDRAAALGQQHAAQLQQELMRQQGFEQMRESDAQLQTERLGAQAQLQLSSQQAKLLSDAQNKQFQLGLASAQNLEQVKNTLSPEQYQQAREQWDTQFGDAIGGYPFMGGRQQAPDVQVQGAKSILSKWFGDGVTDDMVQAYLELPGADKLKFGLDAEKLRIDQRQAEEQFQLKQAEAQQAAAAKALEQQQKVEATERANALDIQNQLQALEVKARTEQLKIASSKVTEIQKALVTERSVDTPSQDRIAQFESDLDAAMKEFSQLVSAPSSVNLLGGGQQPQSQPQSQSTMVQTPDGRTVDYNKLNSGDKYIHPGDGSVRTKR